eukprot:COSAG06_NODE_56238_length_285_cov_2.225806_2_plen_32_part_01
MAVTASLSTGDLQAVSLGHVDDVNGRQQCAQL